VGEAEDSVDIGYKLKGIEEKEDSKDN